MSKNNTPKLRFPEFSDDWKNIYLKDLLSFKNGLNAPKEKYGNGIKFINVLDILENDFITYDIILDSVDATEEQIKSYNVSYGDILFQRSSETREEVGIVNVYLDKEKDCIFGGFVIRGKKLENYVPFFIKEALKTSNVRKDITSRSGGSTRYNIGQNSLENVMITVPIIEEQEKIANFLSKVDEKISLLEENLKLWNSYKKGIMQQLFTQKLRFKSANDEDFFDWKETKLEKIGQIITGTTPSTKNKKNYENGTYLWVTPTDINKSKLIKHTDRKLSEEGMKNGRVIPKNSILVTCIASIGKNCILTEQGSCNQQINAIHPYKNYNIDFIYYLIDKNAEKLKQLAGITATPILNKTTFSKMKFFFPSIEEQNKIANFLTEIDKKIDKIGIELEKIQEFKKCLLQQMFC
ncbi:MAG: restriction endonuclease subunit S [Methanobrevibacter sp.]|nr:restriction endonuclease subunit S [Methanobrevibacter sp.]